MKIKAKMKLISLLTLPLLSEQLNTVLLCNTLIMRSDVVILKNVLSVQELEALSCDCAQASKIFTTEEQYAEASCGT